MVSHPETGSDSPIGSDRDRGHDIYNPHERKLDPRTTLGFFIGYPPLRALDFIVLAILRGSLSP